MTWPRAITLDFYGTLVEEFGPCTDRILRQVAEAAPGAEQDEIVGFWVQGFRALCNASHGPRFEREEVLEARALHAAFERFGVPLQAHEVTQRLYDCWRSPAPFPDAALLDGCRLPICLLSNVDNADLAAALRHTRLRFDPIVTSEDCRAYKPHPAPFRRALERLGLAPGEVLHVGDSLGCDVAGARRLGIPVLWVNRTGRALPARGSRPDFAAPDLCALPEIMQRGWDSSCRCAPA